MSENNIVYILLKNLGPSIPDSPLTCFGDQLEHSVDPIEQRHDSHDPIKSPVQVHYPLTTLLISQQGTGDLRKP